MDIADDPKDTFSEVHLYSRLSLHPLRVVSRAQVVPERSALLLLHRLLRRLTPMEAARSSLSSSQSGQSRRTCSSTFTTTMSRCCLRSVTGLCMFRGVQVEAGRDGKSAGIKAVRKALSTTQDSFFFGARQIYSRPPGTCAGFPCPPPPLSHPR